MGQSHSLTLAATDESPSNSDDGETFAAFEAAGADDFASAFGGHTGAITNLAGAFLAVRTECRLHDFCKRCGVRTGWGCRRAGFGGGRGRSITDGAAVLAFAGTPVDFVRRIPTDSLVAAETAAGADVVTALDEGALAS